jgi:hypothetical protein
MIGQSIERIWIHYKGRHENLLEATAGSSFPLAGYNLFNLAFQQIKSIGSGMCYSVLFSIFTKKILNHLKIEDMT